MANHDLILFNLNYVTKCNGGFLFQVSLKELQRVQDQPEIGCTIWVCDFSTKVENC